MLPLSKFAPIRIWNRYFTKFNVISDKKLKGKTSKWFILSYDMGEDLSYSEKEMRPTIYFFSSQVERDEQFKLWKDKKGDYHLQSFTAKIPYLIE